MADLKHIAALVREVYAPLPAASPAAGFSDIAGSRPFFLYGYGRTALHRALLSLGVKAGDAVLFPDFICRDLLSSARAIGAKVVYYPVTPELRPATEPREWPGAKAVVAVNYFGFAQDLAPFRAYAERTGAALIEDNAHGLFSRDAEGAFLGTRGDVGVFSLRKTLPLYNGGALLVNSARADLNFLRDEPPSVVESSGFRVKTALRGLVPVLGPGFVTGATALLRRLRKARTGHEIVPSAPEAEERLPVPEGPWRSLAAALSGPAAKEQTGWRRELYAFLAGHLDPARFAPVFAALPEGTCPYVYPFRCEDAFLDAARKRLAEVNLECFNWPELPDDVRAGAPDFYRQVRCVRFLW